MASTNCEPQNSATNSMEEFAKIKFSGLKFQNTVCYYCKGYYEPCFDEPVCSTCHLFLYPEDINAAEEQAEFAEKTDDCDSGNEEPTDCYCWASSHHTPRQSLASPKTDKLAERIAALSIPRENERSIRPGLVEMLPPEVLLVVFSFLDDIALWNVGEVCKRWRHVLNAESAQERWHQYTQHRWPLFRPLYPIQCWKSAYARLLQSAPCKLCLQQATIPVESPNDENTWRRNRLRNELKSLQVDPPDGIEASPLDRWCVHWHAAITGPAGSPYEGGSFFLYIQIPHSYPMCPPHVRFITKIFHPNINRHGDIGIDSIQHNWSLALTISKVLISIQSLLTDPYCHVCMEPDVGELYQKDRALFNKYARLWTWKYAMHDGLMPTEDIENYWRSITL